jgi:hypothetical protein
MESQLNSLRIAEVQAERQQLLTRRWLPGVANVERGQLPPLWLAKDSPSKFHAIFEILDDFQKWYDKQECPEAFPEAMHALYGEHHSRAGEKIRTLFIDLFGDDKGAAAKAGAELPKWIAQERSDVEREHDLYRKEWEIKANAGPSLTEEEVAKKEAALERQIREQTRLLLQLKKTRSEIGNREQGRGGQGKVARGVAARDAGNSFRVGIVRTIRHRNRTRHGGRRAASKTNRLSISRLIVWLILWPFGRRLITRQAEGATDDTATEHKTAADGEIAAKNEKMGQSNPASVA